MINLRTKDEVEKMAKSAKIAMECMNTVEKAVSVGVTTRELDKIVEDIIISKKAIPSFKGYNGFPSSICSSINEEVVHGIPSKRKLKDGDIIGIDLGVILNNYHSDMARTFLVGNVSDDVCKLVECAKLCFEEALGQMYTGNRLGDIGWAAQNCAESRGYSIVRSLCGHGIGTELHEDPEVPNFGRAGHGLRLKEGMVLAVEPMINIGCKEVKQLSDGWTIVTADMKCSAHYENTVYISKQGPVVLTDLNY